MCKEYINRIKIALAEQPSLEQLVEIAKVLEISPKDLINDIRQ